MYEFDPEDVYLSRTQLWARGVRWSRVHLWRLERDGKFPKRIHLGPQTPAWKLKDINAWLAAKATASAEGRG